MTYSEELVIINKRIPEQEAYIESIELEQSLQMVVLESLPEDHPAKIKRKRLNQLLDSALGVLNNLKRRRTEIAIELQIYPKIHLDS